MSQDLFGEFSKRLPQVNVEGSGLRHKSNSIFLNRENKIILDIFRIHVLDDLTSTDNYKDLVQKTFSTIKIGDLTKRKGVDKNTIYFSYLTQLKNLYSIRGTHLSTSLLKYCGSHISI